VSSQQKPTSIDSVPSKLAYRVSDANGAVVSQGVTPSQVTLNRSSGYFKPGKYTIEIKKGGKVVGKETISAGINGWYLGNVVIGGLIGLIIVDPLSGAMYRMPESVTVNTTSTAAASPLNSTLQIVDISTLTSEQRGKLVRI
jgi:hypothetical protein